MANILDLFSDDAPSESGANTPESAASDTPAPATVATGLAAAVLRLRKGQTWLTNYLDAALVALLDEWTQRNAPQFNGMPSNSNNGRKVTPTELYRELKDLADTNKFSFEPNNAESMGMKITELRELLNLLFEVECGRTNRDRFYSFTRRDQDSEKR